MRSMTGRASSAVRSGERQTPKCSPGTASVISTSRQSGSRTLVLARDRLGLLDMRDAIHHQRDARAVRRRPRHRRQIVGMPDGIADEQVVECPALPARPPRAR